MIALNNNIPIIAKNVKVTYGSGELAVHAVRGVSLEVNKGEIIAIEGPSGSGKTSLMMCLGGIMKPTNGEVWVDGVPVHSSSENELSKLRRNKIGFIFQEFYLIPTMNALENVMVPLIPIAHKIPDLKQRAIHLLEEVGLGNRLHHKPKQLSGGEKQRVAIARALINNPQIILGDEITGNLDTKTGKQILKHLFELRDSHGLTIVLITHDKEVSKQCDRVIKIRDGKILEETN